MIRKEALLQRLRDPEEVGYYYISCLQKKVPYIMPSEEGPAVCANR